MSEEVFEYDPVKAEWVPCTDEFRIKEHFAAANGEMAPGDRTEEELRELENRAPAQAGPVITANENVISVPTITDENVAVRDRKESSGGRRGEKAEE